MLKATVSLVISSAAVVCGCGLGNDEPTDRVDDDFRIEIVAGRADAWSPRFEVFEAPSFGIWFDARYDNTLGAASRTAVIESMSLVWHGRKWRSPWLPEPSSSGEVAAASAVTLTHQGGMWGETPFGIDCRSDWVDAMVLEVGYDADDETRVARRRIECECHSAAPDVPDPR